jgi:hypothetical protein
LGIIEVSAFLHQHQRDRDPNDHIVASPDDYKIAKSLFEHAYYSGPDKDISQLLTMVESRSTFFPHGNKSFAVTDIIKGLGWQQTKAYEVLNRSLEIGCIANGEKRGEYVYIRGTVQTPLQLPPTVGAIDAFS